MTKLFNAAKNNDVDAVKKLVCKADIVGSEIPGAQSGVLGIEVRGTNEKNGVTTVDVSLTAAYSYVLAAQDPILDPNACVYKHSVPASVTASLKGKDYEPEAVDTNAPVQRFTAKDGSTLRVTTAKESDGKYYVIAVVKG